MNSYNKDFQDLNDEELSAEITRLAKNYQASEFPNPERADCLSDKRLRAIAKSDALPDTEIRRHLLNCSPCFNKFQEVKNGVKSAAVSSADSFSEKGAKKFFPFSFLLKPIPALIMLFLLIGGVAAIFYLSRNTSEKYVADNNKILDDIQNGQANDLQHADKKVKEVEQVANDETKDSNGVFSRDRSNSLNKKKEEQETVKRKTDELNLSAKMVVNLDLSKAAVFRNDDSQVRTNLLLPSSQIKVNVKLPENYPAGKYRVSLLDEFGKPLITDQTISSNGKTAVFKLNLKNKTGSARLCVAPIGETPDCFAIKISRSP